MIRLAPLAAIVLALAACGTTSSPPSASPPSSAASAPSAGVASSDQKQKYLAVARAQGVDGSDNAVISTARNACQYLDDGRSMADVVTYVRKRHVLSSRNATAVADAAVLAYCPRNATE